MSETESLPSAESPLEPVFVPLTSDEPLGAQVAAHLLLGVAGSPADLSEVWVIVPTAGAARSIREALATYGVLTPRFLLPMQALDAVLPGCTSPIASGWESLAAWSQVLLTASASEKPGAFLPLEKLSQNPQTIPALAATLSQLCDQLAVGGLHPMHGKVLRLEKGDSLGEDPTRWDEVAELYDHYLKLLRDYGLVDANHLRLTQSPRYPEKCQKIVVACVPDLPLVVRQALAKLLADGLLVQVLGWSPSGQHRRLSFWGQPDVSWWGEHLPEVPQASLVAANTPAQEIAGLWQSLPPDAAGAWAAFAVAPEAVRSWQGELERLGFPTYSPDGEPLATSEMARIAAGWEKFLASRTLRDLRLLLDCPAFVDFLATRKVDGFLDAASVGRICEFLITQGFCETVESAGALLEAWVKDPNVLETTSVHGKSPLTPQPDTLGCFLAKLGRALQQAPSGQALLENLVMGLPELDPGERTALALTELSDIWHFAESSSLLRSLPQVLRKALLNREVERRRIFLRQETDAVAISGWLEVPWTRAKYVLVAGCREGALPGGSYEDAFLPDSARKSLGLPTQEDILARDAYLLSCLISRGQAVLGFSRNRERSEPTRPSRLLFGCAEEELPHRVQALFAASGSAPARPVQAAIPWTMDFAEVARVAAEKIRVTSFKDYLECPFRFFLKHRLRLSDEEQEARQIDRRLYGSVVHKVLEIYGEDQALQTVTDAAEIEKYFVARLDEVLRASFGAPLLPAVSLQAESMRQRLRALAVLQAAEVAQGWRIIATEKAPPREGADAVFIGGLLLTGSIDRVEINPSEKILRVLDYKTFAKPKTPMQTHLATKPGHELLRQSMVEVGGKEKYWKDLQLPLYVHLAGKLFPDYADWTIQAGYCLVPPDSTEPSIALFEGLDAAMVVSALACAEEVAASVKAGKFWPPAEKVQYDSFEEWFVDVPADRLLSPATIQALQGNH